MPTPDEWRAKAEAWVPTIGLREPTITSADKAYAWMREHEMYVPRAYVRDVWRETKRGDTYIDMVNRLTPDMTIPRTWHKEGYSKIKGNYLIVGELTGRDLFTGEEVTHTVGLVYEEAPTVGEIQEEMERFAMDYIMDVTDVTYSQRITSVYHRRGRPW